MNAQPRVNMLIQQAVKAAVLSTEAESRQARVQGAAMLQAFAVVAADVLGLTIAPAGFELAVREALAAEGMPPRAFPFDAQARMALTAWHHRLDLAVRDRIENVGGDAARDL